MMRWGGRIHLQLVPSEGSVITIGQMPAQKTRHFLQRYMESKPRVKCKGGLCPRTAPHRSLTATSSHPQHIPQGKSKAAVPLSLGYVEVGVAVGRRYYSPHIASGCSCDNVLSFSSRDSRHDWESRRSWEMAVGMGCCSGQKEYEHTLCSAPVALCSTLVPCVTPLVPCVVPLLPCVVPLLPCVAPLVPCAATLVPCVVPLVPCVWDSRKVPHHHD